MATQLHAVRDLVFVRPTKPPETSASGLIALLPSQDPEVTGRVISVGSLVEEIAIGDTVAFAGVAGLEIVHEGQTYVALSESDVLAVITDAPQHTCPFCERPLEA